MNAKDVIGIIREKASEAERAGATQVPISNLRILIDQIDRDTSADPAKTPFGLLSSANHETALAKYRVRVDFGLEQFKSVMAVGQTALKSMFMVNGGAAVAVLAFAGHLATSGAASAVQTLACPLACFVVGLLLVTIASGLTYLAQRAYATRRRQLGSWLNAVIITVAAFSVAAFATGSWFAYLAVAKFSQIPVTKI